MFPENFPDIANWKFQKVWDLRPEFCKACLAWTNTTGLFLEFQKFCKMKSKESKKDAAPAHTPHDCGHEKATTDSDEGRSKNANH